MDKSKELFLLAKINTQQAITAHLAAVMQMMFAAKGSDFLGAMHHNLRESMRTKAVIKEGADTGIDPLELQAMMLKDLDYFLAQARHYADIAKPK